MYAYVVYHLVGKGASFFVFSVMGGAARSGHAGMDQGIMARLKLETLQYVSVRGC